MTTITETTATFEETIATLADFAKSVAFDQGMGAITDTDALASNIAYATFAITGYGTKKIGPTGSAVYASEGKAIIENILCDCCDELIEGILF